MRFLPVLSLLALPAVGFPFTSSIQAQKPFLKIADTVVTLAAPVQPVVDQLRKDFLVREVEGSPVHTWLVSKTIHDLPIASIYSKNGSIIGVHNSLSGDKEPSSALDLFNVIYKASVRVGSSPSPTFCKLTPGSSYEADTALPMSKESIRFDCGPYSFYILRNTFQSQGKLVSGFVAMEEIGTEE